MLLNSTQSSFLSSIHLCVFFLSPFLSVSAAARSARFFFLFSFFLFSNLTIFPGFYFLFSLSVCLFPFRRFVLPLLRDFFFCFLFFLLYLSRFISRPSFPYFLYVCVLLLSLSGCLICMLSSSAYWADAILFSAASNSF